MNTVLVAALLLTLAAIAVVPAATADPVQGHAGPCSYYLSEHSGYVACCPLSVSYGGSYMCVPRH